jgi:SAM-dependent methyltransferase
MKKNILQIKKSAFEVVQYQPRTEADNIYISNIILDIFSKKENRLKFLEAGCGQRWELGEYLDSLSYKLTGIDLSEEALCHRKHHQKDLDEAIVGDLSTFDFPHEEYDLIYCSYVLEHAKNAEKVLDNLIETLKPGGVLVLRIPDLDTAYTFLAKITPFWFHVFYRRFFEGDINAGMPGYDPFPTVFEPIVSRQGILEYCQQKDLIIYSQKSFGFKRFPRSYPWGHIALKIAGFLSFGRLDSSRIDLLFIVAKPTSVYPRTPEKAK